jgi:hypothetical protein
MNTQERIEYWSQKLGEGYNGRMYFSWDDRWIVEDAIQCVENFEFDTMEELEALNKLGGHWLIIPEDGELFSTMEELQFVRLQLLEALSKRAYEIAKHIPMMEDDERGRIECHTMGRYYAYKNAVEIISNL